MTDAGFDARADHHLARVALVVTPVMPAAVGRPTDRAPTVRFRQLMRQCFAARTDAPDDYGQLTQSGTVHSTMKRKLGERLRSILPRRRRREMGYRSAVHNLMLGRADHER